MRTHKQADRQTGRHTHTRAHIPTHPHTHPHTHAPHCMSPCLLLYTGASTAIVHLLPHFEHLSHPLAAMLATFAREHDSPGTVAEVLREIAKIDPRDFVLDASGSRYFAQFLAELANLVPDLVLPSLSLLLPHLGWYCVFFSLLCSRTHTHAQIHARTLVFVRSRICIISLVSFPRSPLLSWTISFPPLSAVAMFFFFCFVLVADGEAYPIRNAILRMIGSILSQQLRADLAPNMVATRDELLFILEERLIDVSAYVRKNALQVWQQLAQDRAIPLKQLHRIVSACLERLQDKSSLVRKQALAFMTTIMACNPYGDRLDSATFDATLAAEKSKLDAMIKAEGVGGGSRPDDSKSGAGAGAASDAREGEEVTGERDGADDDEDDDDDVDELLKDDDEDGEEKGTGECSGAVPCDDDSSNEGAEGAESADLKKQRVVTAYLRDAAAFSKTLDKAVPIVAQLLGSTTTSDVTEAIK